MTALGVSLLEQATTANEILVDRAIRHAVFLERFKSGEVRRMLGFLNTKVFPDVVGQLVKLDIVPGGFDSNRARRLQQTLASMRGTMATGMRSAGLRMTKSMERFALSEARWQTGVLRDATPAALNIGFNTPSLQTLATIVKTRPLQGKTLAEWFGNVNAQAADKLRSQVGIGMLQGESLPGLTKRVKSVLNTTRRSAEAVTRTTVNGIGANAREAAYADNSDIIKGVQWLSTLDDRTTLICAGLDGRVFKVGEGERPPAHVQCRSTTVPVLKGVSEGSAATRASMNGQVAAKTTYGQWLKKQPLKIQENVLGKVKAQLFRKGKIDITRFTDNKNNVLNLKQLKRTEARLAGKTLGPSPRKGSLSGAKTQLIKPKTFPKPKPLSTTEVFRDASGKWTPERTALHEKILSDLGTSNVTRVKNPSWHMLGGGPASGKGTILKSGLAKFPKKSLVIDSDEIKKLLPEFQSMVKKGDFNAASFVHEESSYIAQRASARITKGGGYGVLDGTGNGNLESLREHIAGMRSSGHKVNATYVTVDTKVALARNLKRAERTGRLPPPKMVAEKHKLISKTLPRAIDEGLFDELQLFDTNGSVPRLILSYKNGVKTIHNNSLWQRFLRKANE